MVGFAALTTTLRNTSGVSPQATLRGLAAMLCGLRYDEDNRLLPINAPRVPLIRVMGLFACPSFPLPASRRRQRGANFLYHGGMDNIRCMIIAMYCMLALLATVACSSDHVASDHDQDFAGHPAIAGMTYEAAKTELIRAGWRPIPANCSEQIICYEDRVLASNLETMKSCAGFRNESRRIEICLGIVPDRARVESVREMP